MIPPKFPKVYSKHSESEGLDEKIFRIEFATKIRVKDEEGVWKEAILSDYITQVGIDFTPEQIMIFSRRFMAMIYKFQNLYIPMQTDATCPLQLEEKDRATIIEYLETGNLKRLL